MIGYLTSIGTVSFFLGLGLGVFTGVVLRRGLSLGRATAGRTTKARVNKATNKIDIFLIRLLILFTPFMMALVLPVAWQLDGDPSTIEPWAADILGQLTGENLPGYEISLPFPPTR
jgi:hypothetical protein